MKHGVEQKQVHRVPPGHIHARRFREFVEWERIEGMPEWYLAYTHGGQAVFADKRGKRRNVSEGDLVLYRPGSYQWYRSSGSDRPWDYTWVTFHARPTWGALLQLPPCGEGMFHMSIPPGPPRARLERALRKVVACYESANPYRHDLGMNALEEGLLWLAVQRGTGQGAANDAAIAAAADFIHSHFRQPLTLRDVARASGQSVSRLTSRFRSVFGNSVQEYIEQLRMDRASELLRLEPDAPLSEIAYELGYANAFYFSRRFKMAFGMSPSEYRQDRAAGYRVPAPEWRNGRPSSILYENAEQ